MIRKRDRTDNGIYQDIVVVIFQMLGSIHYYYLTMQELFGQNGANADDGDLPIHYSDDVHSQEYIEQFLSISQVGQQKSFQDQIRYLEIKEIDPNHHQHKQPSTKNRQKSSFHNFQKHLVTTLRNNIKINSCTFSSHTLGIQKKLWRCFMESHRPTKTLIFLITGSIALQTPTEDTRLQKLYGLHPIYCKFQKEWILQAQKNLREEILVQFQKIDIECLLNNRRMKKKQQFKSYLVTFYNELKQGRVNRRLPKDIRQEIKQSNKVTKLEEQQ